MYCELMINCYHYGSPQDERTKAIGRRAFLVSETTQFESSTNGSKKALEAGKYDEALGLLGSMGTAAHRSLKLHQYIFLSTGIVKLTRSIRR